MISCAILLILRILNWQTRYMNEEMFPGVYFIEAMARTERAALVGHLGQALLELSNRLKP